MSSYPPPPYTPPPSGYDPRDQRRYYRDQARAQKDFYRAQARVARSQYRGLRRSSIVGPVLLIALGVVFLYIQFGWISALRVSEWYGRWWPSILVFAGIVLLIEWAYDQHRLKDPAQPQYRRSAGGGVLTLLVLLGVFGFLSGQVRREIASGNPWWNGLHVGPDNIDEFFGDKHESDQTLDLALAKGTSLELNDPRGDVTLSGTSDDGHIHIAVHKEVYSRTDSEADSKAAQLNPHTETAGTVLSLSMPKVEGTRTDLVITLPPDSPVTVTCDRGDLHVASMKAPVIVTANHGDVELSGLTGPATAHVNSGNSSVSAHSLAGGITIQGHATDVTLSDIAGAVSITGEFFGTTHLEHIAGPVHFQTSRTNFQLGRLDGEIVISPNQELTADQVLGPVVLTTSNRNINLDRVQGDVSVTNRNGFVNVALAPALGSIDIQNRNGSVKAVLPEHATFGVQAATSDGDIRSDFALNPTGDSEHRALNASVGSGGPTLRITTTHGDISLDKGDLPPLPVQPPVPPRLSIAPAAPGAPSASAPVAPRTPRRAPSAPPPPSGANIP